MNNTKLIDTTQAAPDTTDAPVFKPLVPRKYQRTGIEYLTTLNCYVDAIAQATPTDDLSDPRPRPTCARHMLTDAPGAGKTFQASEAALALLDNQTQSIAIFCPKHLVEQWFDFCAAQYPQYRTISLEGTLQSRKRSLQNKAKFYIFSIQSLRSKSDEYRDLVAKAFIANHTTVCIVDESHYVKNDDANQSKAIRYLTRPAFVPHVILLTATPVVREADDLYHQLRVTDPVNFHNKDSFMRTYCYYGYSSWGYTNVTLRRDAIANLATHIMGRSYADIGLELPPIIPPHGSPDALVKTPLSALQRKAYDDMKNYWYTTLIKQAPVGESGERVPFSAESAMEVMHLLRHMTNTEEKRETLAQYLETDPGPFLVGCFYRKSAEDVARHLQAQGYNTTLITGATTPASRPVLAKLATGPKDVVIATIPSISEGVDLSHMSSVQFYEEDFTPGKMYQFMSRVRRHRNHEDSEQPHSYFDIDTTANEQGTFSIHMDDNPNTRPVIVRYHHATKTIDERIHMTQSNRATSVKDLLKVELMS